MELPDDGQMAAIAAIVAAVCGVINTWRTSRIERNQAVNKVVQDMRHDQNLTVMKTTVEAVKDLKDTMIQLHPATDVPATEGKPK